MKKYLIIFILIFSGCKNNTESKFIPFPVGYEPQTPYEDLVEDLYTGEDDFSQSLNTFMSGPISQIALSRPDTPSAGCGLTMYGQDFIELKDEDQTISARRPAKTEQSVRTISRNEQMNGFPLSISYKNVGSVKGEKQAIWDECKGIKSNYDDGAQSTTCKKRKVSKEFIEFFDKNFAKCVQTAAKGQKGASDNDLESIKFSHAGISGDPRHSNRSYHSVNRAMDIRTISYIQDGKKVNLKVSDQKKSPAKEFFTKFRKCWSKKIVENKSNCPGGGMKGSIGHENHNHQHHLHLSLPYCPRNHNGSRYYSK